MPQIIESNCNDAPVITAPKRNFYIIANSNDLNNTNLTGFNIILCPNEYSPEIIDRLITDLNNKSIDKKNIYLNLPIISTETEMQVLDEILSQQKIGIVANNYAHLHWVKKYRTIAGIGLNVHNQHTATTLFEIGCENVIWSIESIITPNYGSALTEGYPALMTLCHCPVREVYGSNCAKCRYHTNLIYQDEKNNQYHLRRIKIQHCYFELISEEKYQRVTNAGKIYDLRRCNGKI